MPGLQSTGYRFRDTNQEAIHQLWLLFCPNLLQRIAVDATAQRADQIPEERRLAQVTTRVISLRVPAAVSAALALSAADAGLSVSGTVDWLLSNSFSNCLLLTRLTDSLEALDAKLDVRIPLNTFEQLGSVSKQMGIPISVYTRKLFYHFFVSKKLRYVPSEGHYTLAGRHD
jgi:hypothetical protein